MKDRGVVFYKNFEGVGKVRPRRLSAKELCVESVSRSLERMRPKRGGNPLVDLRPIRRGLLYFGFPKTTLFFRNRMVGIDIIDQSYLVLGSFSL